MGLFDNGMERLTNAMEKKVADVRRTMEKKVREFSDNQILSKLATADGVAREVLEEEAMRRGLL